MKQVEIPPVEIPDGGYEKITVCGLTTHVTDPIAVPALSDTAGMQKIITSHTRHMCVEANAAQVSYGVPSVLIRIDTGKLPTTEVYEIEPRPAGIGILSQIDQTEEQTRRLCSKLTGQYEPLTIVSGGVDEVALCGGPESAPGMLEDIHATAAALGTEVVAPTDHIPGQPCIAYRYAVGESSHITPDSLVPVDEHDNKQYMVDQGAARVASLDSVDMLIDHGAEFAIKPIRGTKCRDVEVYRPGAKGSVNKTKARSMASPDMMIQPIVEPIEVRVEGMTLNGVLRAYYTYNRVKSCYQPGVAVIMARTSLKVHGASDALIIPVVRNKR